MIRIKINKNEEKYKILVIIALLSVSAFLTYYFQVLLKISIIYTHFFYVPIILACLWWKRKGLIVPIFLVILLIFFPIFLGLNFIRIDDCFRVFIFLSVGIIISILSEQISKSEQQLKESEEWFLTTCKSIGDAVIATDKLGNIKLVNLVAESLTGWKQEEGIGKPLEDIFNIINGETRKSVEDPVSRVILEGVVVGLANNTVLITKDGKEIPIADSGAPIKDDKGNIIGVVLIFRDITDRRKAELELQRYKTLVNTANAIILAHDNDWKVTIMNPYACNVLGYEEGEMIGRDIRSMLEKNEYEKAEPVRQKVSIDPNMSEKDFKQYFWKKGKKERILISWNVTAVKDADGKAIGIQGVGQDITARKKMEQKLKESEEKYRNIINNTKEAIIILKIDGEFSFVSPQLFTLLGINKGKNLEIKNIQSLSNFIHPDDLNNLIFLIKRGIKKKAVVYDQDVEFRALHKEGHYMWLSASSKNYYDENGNVIGFISVLRDVTTRKKAEQKLKESEEKYRFITENANDLISVLDKNFNLIYLNDTIKKMSGFTKKEIIGKNPMDYIHPDDVKICLKIFQEVLKTGEGRGEYRMKRKDGIYIWLEVNAKIIIDKNNESKFILVSKDISERKLAENKLKESEENLRVLNIELEQKVLVRTKELSKSEKKYHEAYNRAEFYKDIFTHDINNILQSILSGILLSEMSIDNPENLEELKTNYELIKKQIKRGAKLVSNIRKLSKLEETEILIKKIEIYNILEKSITYVKNTYQDRNLNIKVDSVGEKLYIQANELIEDVFENILINAVKYNEKPTVDIIVRISREQEKGGNYLKMEFIDNSIGIEDTRKNLIFKRGVSKDISIHGMGIGLSLVKKIIETYNGKIWVEDRVKGDHSKGSNFVFLIPEMV